MPYYSGRKQRIAGVDFQAGQHVPAEVINRLKPSVVNQMLGSTRLRFSDKEPSRVRPKLIDTKPGGWYVFDNGMRIHGKKALEEFYAELGA
jgi:hypothetical protein